jgi:hypothetical protein
MAETLALITGLMYSSVEAIKMLFFSKDKEGNTLFLHRIAETIRILLPHLSRDHIVYRVLEGIETLFFPFRWEALASYAVGVAALAITGTNIFIETGLVDATICTDVCWNASYLIGALVALPASMLTHDGIDIVKSLREAYKSHAGQ